MKLSALWWYPLLFPAVSFSTLLLLFTLLLFHREVQVQMVLYPRAFLYLLFPPLAKRYQRIVIKGDWCACGKNGLDLLMHCLAWPLTDNSHLPACFCKKPIAGKVTINTVNQLLYLLIRRPCFRFTFKLCCVIIRKFPHTASPLLRCKQTNIR